MFDPRPVKRCVCFDTTFAELKAAGVESVADAREKFGCGSSCGSCVPYIERMLETGETAFSVLELSPRAKRAT